MNGGLRWDLETETLRLPYADRFRIARSVECDYATTVILTIRLAEQPSIAGVGEGYPEPYYGDTPAVMAAALELLAAEIGPEEFVGDADTGATALRRLGERLDRVLGHHGAAKCALDVAIHDFVGKLTGSPVSRLLGVEGSAHPTDFTLGIDAPEVVARRAARSSRFPALKIKLGSERDLETLEAVREVYGGQLRVDANTAWDPRMATRLLPELARIGVELIEQPFPAGRVDQTRWLRERSPIPIVADESVVRVDDLYGLVGVVDGVNIKLAKCGGIAAGRQMLEEARRLGFKPMLGCMEETRLGIAASAHLAPLADWVDLDGCLLLSDDPFGGVELDEECRWVLADAPGIGVERLH